MEDEHSEDFSFFRITLQLQYWWTSHSTKRNYKQVKSLEEIKAEDGPTLFQFFGMTGANSPLKRAVSILLRRKKDLGGGGDPTSD